jgi:hypothetical protein
LKIKAGDSHTLALLSFENKGRLPASREEEIQVIGDGWGGRGGFLADGNSGKVKLWW